MVPFPWADRMTQIIWNSLIRRTGSTPAVWHTRPVAAPTVRFRRLAEQVADELRRRILSGQLTDDHVLPKEDELLVEFAISKPSLREAMRILEAEGLLTVRRGKRGGAVIHRPTPANVAYTMGLVLGSQQVSLADVGTALLQVEPPARHCARNGRTGRAPWCPFCAGCTRNHWPPSMTSRPRRRPVAAITKHS